MKENKWSWVVCQNQIGCPVCAAGGKVTCSPVCGCIVSSKKKQPCTIPRLVEKLFFFVLFTGQSLKCPSFFQMWPQADMLFAVCQEWLNTALWPLPPFQPLPSPLVVVTNPTWPCTEAKKFPSPLWQQNSRWEQRGRSRQLVTVSSCCWNKICWYYYATTVSFWYEESRELTRQEICLLPCFVSSTGC